MAKWMLAAKKADFNKIAEDFNISPILARIIRNRDVTEYDDIKRYLYGNMHMLHSPALMKDMVKGVNFVRAQIEKGAKIRIIGDYDVDGICATYILMQGLTLAKAKVDTVIPHRIKDGYGLNENLIREAYEDGINTIITCDNGIAAKEQIKLAYDLGMSVVVTDHHEVPYEEENGIKRYIIPEAEAVIDPKQEDCTYPYKNICGAVVAYKFIQLLLDDNGRWTQVKESLFKELLSFAALATICDVMELKDENRIIVKEGLKEMEKTTNLGLDALLKATGLNKSALTPYHAGFVIGPCVNATGRLDTAKKALALFNETDANAADAQAEELKALNESRKQLTQENLDIAIKIVEETSVKRDRVLVVYLSECHESLAGIVAGKLKEKYNKPSFVFCKGEEGIKGSGRSIESYNMYEELSKCKDLFAAFGGHPMAAGVSFKTEDDLIKFRKRINDACTLTDEDLEPVVHIDIAMPLAYADMDFIKQMRILEPFGNGNKKPLFAQKNVRLISGKVLGKNKNVGKYSVCDSNGKTYEMIFFGDLKAFDDFLKAKYGEESVELLYSNLLALKEMYINITYQPEINSYMGRDSIQIVMQDYC